ncbi:3903_t:CDS:2, partial [Dentiscutata erythropus]
YILVIELFNDTEPINATTYKVSNELLNILNDLNNTINKDYQSGIGHRLIFDTNFPDKADMRKWSLIMELFDNTDANEAVNKESNELLNVLNDAITEIIKMFSDDMIEFIEFCIHHDVTSAQSIGHLLREKFSGREIYQKSLYNFIQIAKKKSVIWVESDVSDLIRHLYSHQTEDSYWFVEAKFKKNERRLCGLVWLLFEQQNL